MILSHRDIEEIAAAVTKDFNEFFFGPDTDGARLPRGTPIDQFARDYRRIRGFPWSHTGQVQSLWPGNRI